MIFETHAHYDDDAFAEDREEVISSLLSANIGKIVNVGASIASTKSSLRLAEQYKNLYAAVGVHPSDVADLNEETYAWLREQTSHPKAVAVGEIGLDYYWDKESDVQARQREWFRRQLVLAADSGLPVIIHSRDAAEDTMRILKEAGSWEIRDASVQGLCGVIHCYSYSPEMAREFVKMGYYIGVGGVVTFKNARKLKETVEQLPLERILLETDCPYMAPEPYRGKRNQSSYIPYIAEKIAEIKHVTTAEVERVTWENAMTLFSKVK